MKYKCIIFDLDGTLLDTINDITNAINHVILDLGYAREFTSSEVKTFIGHGAHELINAVGKALGVDEFRTSIIYKEYSEYYSNHTFDVTKPFEGVAPTLAYLKKAGIKLGVISNKPDEDTISCINKFFPNVFDFVYGSKSSVPTKPNPMIFYLISPKYDLNRLTTLYVGDMSVDIDFASNVNMDIALATFGYGNYEELKGQKYNLKSFSDLIKIGVTKDEKTI